MYHAKRGGAAVRRYLPAMAPAASTRRPRDHRT